MSKTDYAQPATPLAEALLADLFAMGGVGYAALGAGQEVLMRTAPGLKTATTTDSNFYEELIVNPTLLKLASQRGELDCGGVSYIAIGYGEFTQLIMLTKDGHVSLGVPRDAPVREIAGRVAGVLERHNLANELCAAKLLA